MLDGQSTAAPDVASASTVVDSKPQSWFNWAFHSCEAPVYFTLIITPVAMSISHLRWGIRQKAMRVGKITLATGLILSLLNCKGLKKVEERRQALEDEEAEERELQRQQELKRKQQKVLKLLRKQKAEQQRVEGNE